jgi:hypothetical protein
MMQENNVLHLLQKAQAIGVDVWLDGGTFGLPLPEIYPGN